MKKKYIITVSVLSLLVVSIFVFRQYLIRDINVTKIKKLIEETASKKLNRTVSMERLSITLFGNIDIENISVSFGNDFNSNVRLLKCKDMTIDLSFTELLSGNIVVTGAILSHGTIHIIKEPGTNYESLERNILAIKSNLLKVYNLANNDLIIKFDDFDIRYDDSIQNKSHKVISKNNRIYLTFEDKYLRYKCNPDMVCPIRICIFQDNHSKQYLHHYP